jgi:hypothetical protein
MAYAPSLRSTRQRGGSNMLEEQPRGVLLYYKYLPLGQQELENVVKWMQERCGALGLVGRVRVALDGINATLGGPLSALEEHIDDVKVSKWHHDDGVSILEVHTLQWRLHVPGPPSTPGLRH